MHTQKVAGTYSAQLLLQEEEHEYDIIGHPQLDFRFVVVFPFHPYTDGRKGGEVSAASQRSLILEAGSAVAVHASCDNCSRTLPMWFSEC
jgi:hypothetical protein